MQEITDTERFEFILKRLGKRWDRCSTCLVPLPTCNGRRTANCEALMREAIDHEIAAERTKGLKGEYDSAGCAGD